MLSDDALDLARLRDMTTSGKARRIRLAARLSLHEMARAIGSSHAAVQRWETNERRPRGELALRYLALLDALQANADVA